jgi:hypothetical protein
MFSPSGSLVGPIQLEYGWGGRKWEWGEYYGSADGNGDGDCFEDGFGSIAG